MYKFYTSYRKLLIIDLPKPFFLHQVGFVTKRKNELEKRVEELLAERESLNNTLDDTSDKIILLERHAREQDCQVIYINTSSINYNIYTIFFDNPKRNIAL